MMFVLIFSSSFTRNIVKNEWHDDDESYKGHRHTIPSMKSYLAYTFVHAIFLFVSCLYDENNF